MCIQNLLVNVTRGREQGFTLLRASLSSLKHRICIWKPPGRGGSYGPVCAAGVVRLSVSHEGREGSMLLCSLEKRMSTCLAGSCQRPVQRAEWEAINQLINNRESWLHCIVLVSAWNLRETWQRFAQPFAKLCEHFLGLGGSESLLQVPALWIISGPILLSLGSNAWALLGYPGQGDGAVLCFAVITRDFSCGVWPGHLPSQWGLLSIPCEGSVLAQTSFIECFPKSASLKLLAQGGSMDKSELHLLRKLIRGWICCS